MSIQNIISIQKLYKVNISILENIQNQDISLLSLYPQVQNFIYKNNIKTIKELNTLNEVELINKLKITKDVCEYIYSKIDSYCTNFNIICPNLPHSCNNLNIDILNLPNNITNELKQQNINFVGELASIERDNEFNKLIEACKELVYKFRTGTLFSSFKIDIKNKAVIIEKEVNNPKIEYINSHQNIEDIACLDNLIKLMSQRYLIEKNEFKTLSWLDIAHRLTVLWNVPLNDLNILTKDETVKTIGDALNKILEKNLQWLKNADLSQDSPPSTLKLTPILLQAKEYMDFIKNKTEMFKNNLSFFNM